MTELRPLPGYLVQRYHGWKATTCKDNLAWYRRLAEEGQRPREMVITCCDSRVHVAAMFGSDSDDLFIHRNIAALVPEYQPDGHQHSTSAAIEYGVGALKVSHILVMGHSHCGGVKSCRDMVAGMAPDLEVEESFVGRWLDIIRPEFEHLPADQCEQKRLEQAAVLVSLRNLMTFPVVKQAVEDGTTSLHGLWTDIGEGGLEIYDPTRGRFLPV